MQVHKLGKVYIFIVKKTQRNKHLLLKKTKTLKTALNKYLNTCEVIKNKVTTETN